MTSNPYEFDGVKDVSGHLRTRLAYAAVSEQRRCACRHIHQQYTTGYLVNMCSNCPCVEFYRHSPVDATARGHWPETARRVGAVA